MRRSASYLQKRERKKEMENVSSHLKPIHHCPHLLHYSANTIKFLLQQMQSLVCSITRVFKWVYTVPSIHGVDLIWHLYTPAILAHHFFFPQSNRLFCKAVIPNPANPIVAYLTWQWRLNAISLLRSTGMTALAFNTSGHSKTHLAMGTDSDGKHIAQ